MINRSCGPKKKKQVISTSTLRVMFNFAINVPILLLFPSFNKSSIESTTLALTVAYALMFTVAWHSIINFNCAQMHT